MTSKPTPTSVTIEQIRGSLERARANARTVAALTENPGCGRRRVIDAAGIKAYELAAALGHGVIRGQSPFAITTGNRFERRLKDSDYTLLAEALKPLVDLSTEGLRSANMGRAPGQRVGEKWLRARAKMTEDALAKIARGDDDAPHIVDHPILIFDLAGTPVFLEPDALAFRVGGELELVEIKSYAIIDGQADPSKLAATAGQSAVYLLALRATLEKLGFDPNILRWSVILVAPKNFGRFPVAHRIPLRKKGMALERVLGSLPRTDAMLVDLPKHYTLDVIKGSRAEDADQRDELDRALKRLPMLYVPECLASCDMARYCRDQAIATDDPARLGRAARDNLAGVRTLADALRLAVEGPGPTERHLADVAEGLHNAHEALRRARARAPEACGLTPRPATPQRRRKR